MIAAGALVGASPADATVDGGRSAHLLGVAGDRALVVEMSVQVECSEVPCRAYAVDLSRARQGRSGDRIVHEPTLEAYLTALGEERASLGSVVPAHSLTALEVTDGEDGLQIRAPRGDLTLSLATVASADSMAAYERATDTPCFDPDRGPLCRECAETRRYVWGREASFWSCPKAPGPWRAEPLRDPDCDCHAEAAIVELRLVGAGPSTSSQVLVAPHQLGQNVVGGSREGETTALALLARAIEAHQTARGDVIVTGAVAHAPMANGTYFPVVASTRFSPPRHDAGAGAEPEPEPALPRAGRPRGPACRGCAIDDGAPATPSLLLIFTAAVGVVARRRASRRRRPTASAA